MHPSQQKVIQGFLDNPQMNIDEHLVAKYKTMQDVTLDMIANYNGEIRFIYKIQNLPRYTCKQLAAALRIFVSEARDAAIKPQPAPTVVAAPRVLRPIITGRYTVVLDKREYTLWITNYDGKYDVPKGTFSVKLLVGPDNTRNYAPCAFVYPNGHVYTRKIYRDNKPLSDAINLLIWDEDPIKYGEAYALKSNNCWRCHRQLTRSTSIKRGVGPECAKILGL